MRRFHSIRRRAFTLVELFVVVAVMCVLAAIFLPKWVEQQRWNSATNCRLTCINNLKQVGLGLKTWALDNNDHFPMQVSVTNGGTMELVGAGNVWPHFVVMSNELSTPKILFCPEESDKQRTMADTFLPYTPPPGAPYPPPVPLTNDCHISYFLGVDTDDQFPQMVLAGDHNLLIGGKPAGHGLHSVWTNTPVTWLKPMHQGMGNALLVDGSVQTLTSSKWSSVLIHTGVATNRLAMP
jgi:prepilin-type N-terminal cleavage/methylation domain-containing protein/prepilin-type processing-associated H-X9-DG protein